MVKESSGVLTSPATSPENIDFVHVQQSEDFQVLRTTHRSFVFPLAILFLAWYLVYVLLAMYAPHLMGQKVLGGVNLGIVLGLLQFVTTFAITGAYVAFANRKLDPQSALLREEMERGIYSPQNSVKER